MTLSENKLLAGFDHTTNGQAYCSFVAGFGHVYWTYRSDGAMCYRDDADSILTEDPSTSMGRACVDLGMRYSAAAKKGISLIETIDESMRDSEREYESLFSH